MVGWNKSDGGCRRTAEGCDHLSRYLLQPVRIELAVVRPDVDIRRRAFDITQHGQTPQQSGLLTLGTARLTGHADIGASRIDRTSTRPVSNSFQERTHGPRGDSSYAWFDRIVRRIVKATQQHEQTPWVMAQAYQEIWGPSRLEPDGQVTVLPGGGQHWLLPTPAQIRWQVWTAAALGAKGIFFFAYGVPFQPNPKADPIKEPWAVQKETPTGGPTSLVSSRRRSGYNPGERSG